MYCRPQKKKKKNASARFDLALPKCRINVHLFAADASPLPMDQIRTR